MTYTKGQNLTTALAANLKRVRLKRKLSLRAMGDLASLSGVYIWQIEAGIRNPSLAVVLKLADALEVKSSALLKPLKK